MTAKTCQICGKSSGIYPLCKEHLEMKANGEIIKCEDCGQWHFKNQLCNCKSTKEYTELPKEGFSQCVSCGEKTDGYAFCFNCWKKYSGQEMLDILNNKKTILNNEITNDNKTNEEDFTNEEINNVVTIDSDNKSKCITCGKQTDGLLFCSNCYRKYKDKELLFKITNCSNVELLDESYEGRYTCKDGHIVKSKSERDIDNYLFENDIPHAYEKELPYGPNKKEVLHPDFYLPNYLGKGKHVYIEHWGYNENNIKYSETKKFKIPIYEKLGITLICTYEKTDMANIDATLERKLNKNFIIENQINNKDQ